MFCDALNVGGIDISAIFSFSSSGVSNDGNQNVLRKRK
jgi:hypothetical protein